MNAVPGKRCKRWTQSYCMYSDLICGAACHYDLANVPAVLIPLEVIVSRKKRRGRNVGASPKGGFRENSKRRWPKKLSEAQLDAWYDKVERLRSGNVVETAPKRIFLPAPIRKGEETII